MATTTAREWSAYQNNIFTKVETSNDSILVKAAPGSGKTTTGVEICNRIDESQRVAFIAFNKSIAEELGERVPFHVDTATFHSMAFRAWRDAGNRSKVDGFKVANIVRDMDRAGQLMPGTRDAARKLVSVAKSVGLGYLTGSIDNNSDWMELADYHMIEADGNVSTEDIINAARIIYKRSMTIRNIIDFDDMILFPIVFGGRWPQYDAVLIDEAQDTNSVQRAALRKMIANGGRLIAIGDPAQSIYGFRGADSEAMNLIRDEFNCIEMPLTVSYRCAASVVREASAYGFIEAAPSAAQGMVETIDSMKLSHFAATDAVLCRNTAPLVTLAYKCIANRIGVRILGREIGQGLISLVKKMKAESVDQLVDRLARWAAAERERAIKRNEEAKLQLIEDKLQSLMAVINGSNAQTIEQLISSIESLFSDNGKGLLTLCTVHKAKGLEFPTVYILDRYLMPSKYARQPWMLQQETNIQFVAITRAMTDLRYITSKGIVE